MFADLVLQLEDPLAVRLLPLVVQQQVTQSEHRHQTLHPALDLLDMVVMAQVEVEDKNPADVILTTSITKR